MMTESSSKDRPLSARSLRRTDCAADPDASVAAALAALDRFMTALNARDEAALNDALNFPHVRLASGRVTVWNVAGSYRMTDFLARAGDAWHESRWDERTVIHAGPEKVHLAVQFSRWCADGTLIGRYRSIWVVTRTDGKWGVQARSSFAI
jgi:hypothetical protein